MDTKKIELSYYFDHNRGIAFIKDQFVIAKVEYLNCISGTGFEHYNASGIIKSIKFTKDNLCNSSNLNFGQLLDDFWITVVVIKENGKEENICLHEIEPISSIRNTKQEERKFISLFKKTFSKKYNESLNLLGGDKKLLHTYILRVQRYISKIHNSEKEFKDRIFSLVRYKTSHHSDNDGMISICRNDNPYRKLIYE